MSAGLLRDLATNAGQGFPEVCKECLPGTRVRQTKSDGGFQVTQLAATVVPLPTK